MRAILCTEVGETFKLEMRDVPAPLPGEGEVRVSVRVTSVNFADGLTLEGRYQASMSVPYIPGQEFAGIVDMVGDGVRGIEVGAAVVGSVPQHGAFAEQVICSTDRLWTIADDVPLPEAAGFLSIFGTAQHALRQRAGLRDGETLLVLGAGGGVGIAAVQIGVLLGARVIAAASSDEKLALARKYGATDTINYRTESLRDAVSVLSERRGVDVVFDPVGGDLAQPAFRSMAWNGRYLVIGFAGGSIPSLPLNLPLLKGASLTGVFWGAFIDREPKRHQDNMRELFGWLSDGKVGVPIGATFPLNRAEDAIRHVMTGQSLGKTIIEV